MKTMLNPLRLSALCAALLFGGAAQAGEIAVNLAFKGANQRAFWDQTIAAFQKANPDVKV